MSSMSRSAARSGSEAGGAVRNVFPQEHGGDVYGLGNVLDFSVNLSPLGTPEGVMEAVRASLSHIGQYPDPHFRMAASSLAALEGVAPESVVCGGGGAELIHRLVHYIRPERGHVFIPAFGEYERALKAAGARICHIMDPEVEAAVHEGCSENCCENNGEGSRGADREGSRGADREGSCGAGIETCSEAAGSFARIRGLDRIGSGDIVFLCNPCNPTGALTAPEVVEELAFYCERAGALLCIDESFMPLASPRGRGEDGAATGGSAGENGATVYEPDGEDGAATGESAGENGAAIAGPDVVPDAGDHADETDAFSGKRLFSKYKCIVIIKSLTKIFALPGIRAGYALCADSTMAEGLAHFMQPWSMGIPAQAVAESARGQRDYMKRVRRYVGQESARMQELLSQCAHRVMRSDTCFILFKSRPDLGERLLERGILIRDCSSFAGLSSGWFRIGIRSREEDDLLVRNIGAINGLFCGSGTGSC